jgi:hypothetical protein
MQQDPDYSSGDEEELKLLSDDAKGNCKKPQSKLIYINLIGLTPKMNLMPCNRGALPLSKEKPNGRFGKIVEKQKYHQPPQPLSAMLSMPTRGPC